MDAPEASRFCLEFIDGSRFFDISDLENVSPYFQGLNASNMVEARERRLKVDHFSVGLGDMLCLFLKWKKEGSSIKQFIASFPYSDLFGIAEFAHSYLIDDLASAAQSAIIEETTAKNCVTHYVFADRGFSELKRASLRYLLYLFHQIPVENFTEFGHEELATFLRNVGLNTAGSEYKVVDVIFSWALRNLEKSGDMTSDEVIQIATDMLNRCVCWGELSRSEALEIADHPLLQIHEKKTEMEEIVTTINQFLCVRSPWKKLFKASGVLQRVVPCFPIALYGRNPSTDKVDKDSFVMMSTDNFLLSMLETPPFRSYPIGASVCCDGKLHLPNFFFFWVIR